MLYNPHCETQKFYCNTIGGNVMCKQRTPLAFMLGSKVSPKMTEPF